MVLRTTPMDARPADADPPAIADYGVIGDCRSAALVSRDGAIDWLCWPRFDSPAVFAALLDPSQGGAWHLTPRHIASRTRRYVGRTNVLEMTFQTVDGATVTLTDFMPVASAEHAKTSLVPDAGVVRIVRCTSGRATIDSIYEPRPGFGRKQPKLVDKGRLGLRLDDAGRLITLQHDTTFDLVDGVASSSFELSAGQEKAFVLSLAAEAPAILPPLADAPAALHRTLEWWEAWAGKCRYDGRYANAVMRSVLTLKLLSYPMSGAIVAAATTSLPERVGGKLNWDYRYCWLRDAALIVDCLCKTGYVDEAAAFTEWLLHATRRTQPKLRVAYDVHGNDVPREREMSHLNGYRGSKPVRVGNGARDQVQLDTQGELVAAVATLLRHQGKADRETSRLLVRFGRYVCEHWSEPDAGIWEDRGPPVVHTHSRLMNWVALDALLTLHDEQLIDGVPVDLFRTARQDIRHAIESESWLPEHNTYTSEPGRLKLDATLLLMALYDYAPPPDDRMRQTRESLRSSLGVGEALLRRNEKHGDDAEGAFGICGFWDAEFLARGGGTLDQSRRVFDTLAACGNDLGLHAEEVNPVTGTGLGNFPQAFTHVGLIKAALAIHEREQADAATAAAERMAACAR